MKVFSTLLMLLFTISFISYPQTYYVDFENGNDANNGLSSATAWKHAPGDVNATLNPSSVVLSAGSTVLFKGGVHYRGTITMKNSGAADAPITYKGDGWGTDKAIIDGSDVLEADWHQCQTPAEAGGNPHYQNIYYTSYSGTISPFTQIFENGQRAYIAQTPNMTDPFWDDRIDEYLTVSKENITRISIRDDNFFTQPSSNYWNGAYAQIWVNPNVIVITKITAFTPASNTIYFDSLSSTAIYGDRDQYYSIVNHLSALDRAGEYVVDETNKKIYYWPYGSIENCVFSVSVRSYGIGINACSNICLEGLKVQGNTSDDGAYAIWNNRTWGATAENIIIRNCEITHIRTKDGRKGTISFSNTNGLLIENNNIHDCQRNSGILIGAKNVVIRSNVITRIGYKGIWSMGSENLRILNNTIIECEGTHGNPVSVFTTKNSLTANNYMYRTGEAFTFSSDTNMVLHNNVIFGLLKGGEETGSSLIRQNASDTRLCYGYTVITNNTAVFSGTNNSLGISEWFADLSKVIVKNNILDGGIGGTASMSMSRANNIYTGISWTQDDRYGWGLMEGEFIQENLDSIFVNATNYNFHLNENSVARNKGIDPLLIIPQEIKDLFSDYDFSQDYYGKIRGEDGTWDIGAFEYDSSLSLIRNTRLAEPFFLSQNYPNPFNQTTTIEFQIPATTFVSLKIYDISGREIATLVNEQKTAGIHKVQWDGKNSAGETVSSGLYLYRIQTADKMVIVRKMTLLK